jgi:hypothetical protein
MPTLELQLIHSQFLQRQKRLAILLAHQRRLSDTVPVRPM